MNTPGLLRRNAARIATMAVYVSGACYSLALMAGAPGAARLAALVFSMGATAEIMDRSAAVAPRGVAMVSVAAFLLVMEGGGTAIAAGMDEAAFVEIGIGLYLMATLWVLLGRTVSPPGDA